MGNDLLLAQERMVTCSLMDISHVIGRVGLVLLAMNAGWGLLGVYLATISASVVRSVVLVWLNLRRGVRPQFPLDPAIRHTLLLASLPLMGSAVLSLAYQHADKLLTTGILGERSTGYLGPAFLVNFGIIELLSTTVLVAMFPLMSRYYGDERLRASFGYLVEVMSRFMFVVGVPLALLVFAFAPLFISLVYPPEFAPASDILRVLIWYTCITMVGNVFAQALLNQNQQGFVLRARARALLLNVLLSTALLLWRGDVLGAVIATVIAEVVLVGQFVRRMDVVGFDGRRWLMSMGRIALAGVAGGVGVAVGMALHPLLAILCGIFTYATVLLLVRALPVEDWHFLQTLLAALPMGDKLVAVLGRLGLLGRSA